MEPIRVELDASELELLEAQLEANAQPTGPYAY